MEFRPGVLCGTQLASAPAAWLSRKCEVRLAMMYSPYHCRLLGDSIRDLLCEAADTNVRLVSGAGL
jgi:hypothetical protein